MPTLLWQNGNYIKFSMHCFRMEGLAGQNDVMYFSISRPQNYGTGSETAKLKHKPANNDRCQQTIIGLC